MAALCAHKGLQRAHTGHIEVFWGIALRHGDLHNYWVRMDALE